MKFQFSVSLSQVLLEPSLFTSVAACVLCRCHRDCVAGKSSNIYSLALEGDCVLTFSSGRKDTEGRGSR